MIKNLIENIWLNVHPDDRFFVLYWTAWAVIIVFRDPITERINYYRARRHWQDEEIIEYDDTAYVPLVDNWEEYYQ